MRDMEPPGPVVDEEVPGPVVDVEVSGPVSDMVEPKNKSEGD